MGKQHTSDFLPLSRVNVERDSPVCYLPGSYLPAMKNLGQSLYILVYAQIIYHHSGFARIVGWKIPGCIVLEWHIRK